MCKYKRPLTVEEQVLHLKERKRVLFNTISEEDASKLLLEL